MYTDNFEKQFWQENLLEIQQKKLDFKLHHLPLARIKKVMKCDQDVKMISAEAPLLFSKGCELFITELTLRAWDHAVENKRRTLQKSDIAAALIKSDIFDFLIDIVPREDLIKQSSPPQQQQNYVNGYRNYGYVIPPGTQFIMNDPNIIQHQQQDQRQFYMQQQMLNQQMYDGRQQPN